MNEVLYSHKTDDWKTPSEFMSKLHDRGWRDTFPFANSLGIDQFSIFYHKEKIFINPPFSELKRIPSYIHQLLDNNCTVLLLLPSRTDTIYFHQLLEMKPVVFFVKGRLHFNDSKKAAPFPTMLLYFTLRYQYFARGYYSTTVEDFPL